MSTVEEKSNNLGMALRNVNILIKRRMEGMPTIKTFDNVTGTHGFIIGYLKSRESEDVFQKDVEKRFSMRRSTATAILQLMEKNGLIVRESVDYDARLKRIVLTEKANDLCCLFKEEIRKNEELLKKGFSQEELETLIYLLGKVQSNLLEDAKKECERTKCKKQEC